MEAAATPFPSEETTPPVTKMYFGAERKGLDFLRKESAYSALWSQWRSVSNHHFRFYFGENLCVRRCRMSWLKPRPTRMWFEGNSALFRSVRGGRFFGVVGCGCTCICDQP